MQLLMFYIIGFVAVLSAILMVTNIRPVTAAMSLILNMFALAGIYVLLDAHLMAAVQIIVYAGAIMVLFLFVILLLNIHEKEGKTARRKLIIQFIAIVIVGSIFILIANLATIDPALVKAGECAVEEALNQFGTTKSVGRLLFTDFLLPFEIASFVLLAAIVGAVILGKRRIDDSE
jgi:NADH-quinone oxidoreductase subunit J